jgi:hypothetical protein
MAIREGRWRCPSCATVNRGRDLACTGCGATRDADVAFFLEDDAPTSGADADRKRAGADWLCVLSDLESSQGGTPPTAAPSAPARRRAARASCVAAAASGVSPARATPRLAAV